MNLWLVGFCYLLLTKHPPAKAGGFELRTESPDTRRLNDAFLSPMLITVGLTALCFR